MFHKGFALVQLQEKGEAELSLLPVNDYLTRLSSQRLSTIDLGRSGRCVMCVPVKHNKVNLGSLTRKAKRLMDFHSNNRE